jgi:EAL domain-containing protein (putative c-di-GMP-specific phosphodiesterase class I)
VRVSASVGIAFSGRGDRVPDLVLSDADDAMYQAKRAGGSRHQVIDLRERSRSDLRSSLEQDLRGAAERGELRVEYQPIVNTVDGTIVSVEALLRWDHPQRGPIAPTVAIPLAEQSSTICEIGRWVLERACADRNRLQGALPGQTLGVCVNVSPHQLLARDFCQSVEDVLAATDTPADVLTLEMTEGVYVEDGERALVVLQDLHRTGVHLALDDFGTGYSSLAYLRRFPIDDIKIDRSFITGLEHEPAAAAIVGAVIDLAHVLDMSVIAEGVETSDQRDQLLALGCDSCQGFYFALPTRADDLERQLRLQ